MGVDPGTLILGYSIIAVSGTTISLRTMDVLKLPATLDAYERLRLIHARITELVQEYRPAEFAIEAPFFGKNVQSMLKLGRAQGVAIAAAMQGGIPVTEYSPMKVKQSITGKGNADKEQVWLMLERMMGLKERPKYFDATDALAVAVCHFHQGRLELPPPAKSAPRSKKKTVSSWEEFAIKNSERVRK